MIQDTFRAYRQAMADGETFETELDQEKEDIITELLENPRQRVYQAKTAILRKKQEALELST